VVHLGDTNVPNSFVFLDKYVQVSRILAPLVLVVETIPKLLREHPALALYVEKQFGNEEGLVKAILGDFFRHGFVRAPPPLPPPARPLAFCKRAPQQHTTLRAPTHPQDGSGADNFFDA
jgi:hypothetical protein